MDTRKRLSESLYLAWTIGSKDILDALKNMSSMTNIAVVLGMVVFFHFFLNLRPFDTETDTSYYIPPESTLALEDTSISDGSSWRFIEADDPDQMLRRMTYQDLGLLFPANYDALAESGETIDIEGFVFWDKRSEVADLELAHSQGLSEVLGNPVRVTIGANVIQPPMSLIGNAGNAIVHLVYAVVFMAIMVIPHLMIEERGTRTIDALRVSPASTAEVVAGKAIAGMFYMLLVNILWAALNWTYITNWTVVIFGMLVLDLFTVFLALFIGSLTDNMKQMPLIVLPVALFLIVPVFFAKEPDLAPAAKLIFNALPTTMSSTLLDIGVSSGSTPAVLFQNLLGTLAYTAGLFGLVWWRLKRSDR